MAFLPHDPRARLRRWVAHARGIPAERTHRPFALPRVGPVDYDPRRTDITVIVPAFSHAAFIEETLSSLSAQTYPHFTVVVVDDASPDDTVDRARRVDDSRLLVVRNPTNLGLADSVLGMLPSVTTPYVALLNSDDLFHPQRLERCRELLEASPDVSVVATDVAVIDDKGFELRPDTVDSRQDGQELANWIHWYHAARYSPLEGPLKLALLERNFLITSSNIVCRTDFLRARQHELRGLRFCLDWQLFLDAAMRDALTILPERLVSYRLHRRNTVWFRQRSDRAAFKSEVNRVLSSGLRQFAASLDGLDDGVRATHLAEGLRRVRRQAEVSVEELLLAQLAAGAGNRVAGITGAGSSAASAQTNTADTPGNQDLHGTTPVVAPVCPVDRADPHDSPEWLVGDWLWNRWRLRALGQRAVPVARRALDLYTRASLVGGRSFDRLRGRRRVVVTSSWAFPVYSHTFVYQEMLSLRDAGLNPLVFCCQRGPARERQPAFRALWRRRVVLKIDERIARADLAHFQRHSPERVQLLLQQLIAATGWTRERLLSHRTIQTGFTFARLAQLAGAEYIHSYFFYDQSLMAWMAASLLGIPRGITAYADHMLRDHPLKCVALHLATGDVIVATSERIKRELCALGTPGVARRLVVKPNGIDTKDLAGNGPAPEGPVLEVAAVCRIEPKKGLVYLVDAIATLQRQGIRVRLHLVGAMDRYTPGSATYLTDLEARIDAAGVSADVVFHGAQARPQVVGLLRRCHVFAAPYVELPNGDKDGIPTALLEAMSLGLPCVVSDAGSINEVVRHHEEALIVPQRDSAALAEALAQMAHDPDLRHRLGRNGRRRVVNVFDIRVTEPRLHERILTTLAAPHRTGAHPRAGTVPGTTT